MKYLEHHFNSLYNIDLQFAKPISIPLNSYLKENKSLGSSDRFVLKELVYHYLRNKLLIEAIITDDDTISRFNLAIYFWETQSNIAGRKLKTYNNLKESLPTHKIKSKIDKILTTDGGRDHALEYSYPEYLFDSLRNANNLDTFESVLKILHTFAPVSVRKVSQLNNIEFKPKDELNFKESKVFVDSFQSYSEFDIGILPKEIKNNLTIQDDGSRYIANICNPKAGMKILDACSGSGGKSIALSYLAPDSQIIAFDSDKRKLDKLANRVKELDIPNIFTIREQELQKMVGTFDLVLVDAPCTGSGTIRRFPEKKFTIDQDLANSFSEKQFDILTKYSNFVKNGGKLVYSTCSFLSEENQSVTERFQKDSDFEPLEINSDLAETDLKKVIPAEGHQVNLFPIEYDGDIFYVAKFKKMIESDING